MTAIISVLLKLQHAEEGTIVRIEISTSQVLDWCLNLVLLQKALVDSVSIVSTESDEQTRIRLRVDPKLSPSQRGRINWQGRDADLSIAKNELDLWIHFYLKYYRDGIADVDHIDVEIPADRKHQQVGLFLTLTVPHARPPLSETDLRRQLGL